MALPLPPPLLDSGLRRNDEFGGGNHSSGIGVRDVLSYEDWRRSCLPPPLWIPAFAGMTNGGPVAGTIASGIGVRDMLSYEDWRRFASPLPLWTLVPAFAGMTRWREPFIRDRGPGRAFVRRLAAVLPPSAPLDSGLRRNDEWGAGMTRWGAGMTRPAGVTGTVYPRTNDPVRFADIGQVLAGSSDEWTSCPP